MKNMLMKSELKSKSKFERNIKMKRPITILIFASIVLFVGFNIAYYNTSTLLHDNASIISFSSESIILYEHSVRYDDINNSIEKIKNVFYSEYITI